MTSSAHPAAETMRRAASDFFWVPPQVTVAELNEISICYSDDLEHLFNQAVPHAPVLNPEPVVEEIARLHSDRSRWWLTEVAESTLLIDALEQLGYAAADRHAAFFVDTAEYGLTHSDSVTAHAVTDVNQLRDLHKLRSVVFERPMPSEDQLRLELSQCTGSSARVSRFIAKRNGELAGTASITFFDDLGFAFIWAGGVLEAHRGRGVYKALLNVRAAACRKRGIARMGLYGRLETSAPIVEAHGFQRCGFLNYYER